MQRLPPATQDDVEDDSEVMKDPMVKSFQQVRASTDAIAPRVGKLKIKFQTTVISETVSEG